MNDLDDIAGYQDVVTGSRDGNAAPGAAQVTAASAPELKSLLGIAVGTLTIAALYFGRDVLVPITLAVMLAFVLSPIVALLQRLRLWRAPAVILTVIAALAMLGLIGTMIGSQAATLATNAPQYARTIEAKVQGVQGFAVTKLASVTKQFGAMVPTPKRGTATTPGPSVASGALGEPRVVPVQIVGGDTSPLSIAKTVLSPILGPLETTILVLIVAIFVLMQQQDLRDRFIRVFGSSDLHRTTRAIDDAAARLSKYFLSQLAVNTSFGIVIWLGLWAIGIPSPAMWGIMAGLLRFVPYIGAFLGAVAPAALGAAVDPGWTMAIEVIALFLIVEPIVGYVVEPLLYGHSTGLSPVSVIVSAIFWTWLWGPIGLIMSTPLTLCLVVLGRHVKSLEFFDVLLGDRPALTAVESFYQRILADNPDEAIAQAEALLADRSLGSYYDDVVLEGLKLAVEDRARGTIDRAQAITMTRSMLEVIGDLNPRANQGANHSPNRGTIAFPTRVACIAGRGTFDEAVSAMLVQLLAAHDVFARAIPNAAVRRDAIDSLDLSGVAVIAISYLEVIGSPAQLRYLIRRLRAQAPTARIVVGLWPQGEDALSDPEAQHTLGADRYVGSLTAATTDIVDSLAAAAPEPAVAI